ncbi:MAG: hypothetical protein AAF467_19950 [Actinomycetota bacterium]
MTSPSALTGLALGTLGLVAGVVAIAIDDVRLAPVAAVLALAAGACSLPLARRLTAQSDALALVQEQLAEAKAAAAPAASTPSTDARPAGPTAASTPEIPAAESLAHPALSDLAPAARPEPTVDAASPVDPAVSAAAASNTVEPLVDADTGLFSEQFFLVATESRVAAARRHLRPVALVLIEVARNVPEAPSPADPPLVAEVVRATLREADTASYLVNGRYALLLEDTPENGAIWTVERIRRQLLKNYDGLTVWAGIACYPAHAFEPAELLAAADQALVAAREWHQDRIEVAIVAD